MVIGIVRIVKIHVEKEWPVFSPALEKASRARQYARRRHRQGARCGERGVALVPGLPAIAEETGGGYFELTRAEDLASTFARVADELHRQYLIGFEPAKLDDKMHKIEVKVKKPGMKVRARKEYFAAK